MIQNRRSESGQAAILIALAMVALIAFSALAIDGGNAYLVRRNAQNAADAAVINATRVLHQYTNPKTGDVAIEFPDDYLREIVNDAAQRNGVPDTNDNDSDLINGNIDAYYLDFDGARVTELQVGSIGLVPGGAKGIEVIVDIPFDTFIAGIIGRDNMVATTSAGAVFTEKSGTIKSAVYANATDCYPNTLKITGRQQVIGGGMHSNGDVHVNGNASSPSVYTGTLEYATSASISGAIIVNPPDNQATQGPAVVLPLLFDIELYAPGGDKATEAGSNYYYFDSSHNKVQNSDLANYSPPLLDGDGNLRPGIYFAETQFKLNGSLTGAGVTFVTRGEFLLSGSNHYFFPYKDEMILFYAFAPGADACNHTAIRISSSSNVWYGLIYAPHGGVNLSNASNSTSYGSIVAHTVDLSGSFIEIHYDEQYDPIVPPRVVLIW